VRISPVLLPVSLAAGALSVVAALFSTGPASSLCALVMLAALAGHVIVGGRTAAGKSAEPPTAAPRVRWALAIGVGILAAAIAVRLYWPGEPAEDFRWMTPFYAPLDGDGTPAGLLGVELVEPSAELLDTWRQAFDRQQIVAVVQLLGVLCLAVGVLALPRQRRPGRAALTTALALAVLAVVALNVWSRADGSSASDLLGAVWPALLATLVAAGMAALAGWRAGDAWLAPAGALLVAVAAAIALNDLAFEWSAWWRFTQPADVDVAISVATGGSVDHSPEVSAALTRAAELAGPALLTVGQVQAEP
jgi:hypothetical protein